MKSYLNRRLLVTKEYKNLTEPETLTTVTVFQLPTNQEVELDEVIGTIDDILSKHKFDGYEIEDNRTRFECGASGASQEIMFMIMVGISTNISYDILKAIFLWAKKKIYKKEERGKDNFEDYLDSTKDFIVKYFSPTKKLSILDVEKTVTVVKVRLKDDEKNKYYVELFPSGSIIKIKKN